MGYSLCGRKKSDVTEETLHIGIHSINFFKNSVSGFTRFKRVEKNKEWENNL